MGVADEVLWETCAVDGCRGARLGIDGLCLVHCSDEALGQVVGASSPGVDLDGRGVTFDQGSLARLVQAIPLRDERRWIGSARFDGATFESEVGFDETTFGGPASFVGATFSADARFGGATFGADVSFEGGTFAGQAWFVGAAFSGAASFTGTDFIGPAWFQRTRFDAGARFDRTTFSRNVTFSAASFASVSSFAGSQFQSLAVFDKATFAAASSWEDVTFSVEDQGPPPSVLPKPIEAPTVNGQYLDTLSKAPAPAPRAKRRASRRPDSSQLWNVLVPVLALAVLATAAFIILRPDDGGPVTTEDVALPPPTLDPRSPEGQIAATTAPPTTPAPLAPLGDGNAFAFTELTKGTPVRFNRCEALRYVVNPAGAPAGWRDVLTQVVDELSKASGLRIEDKGITDETATLIDPEVGAAPGGVYQKKVDRPSFQPERYPAAWAPVLISWAEITPGPGATPGFDTDGFGGSDSRKNVDGTVALVSGVIVVSKTLDPTRLKAVLLHEFGHVLGLAHVSDPYQVMAATHVNPPATLGAGDVTGLAKLGRESECLNTPTPAP